jgi:hypothetical protein
LFSVNATVRQAPLSAPRPSCPLCDSKWSPGFPERDAEAFAERHRHVGTERGRRVETGSDRGAAQCQLEQSVAGGGEQGNGQFNRARPPADLLSERHRHGIHQVRATELHRRDVRRRQHGQLGLQSSSAGSSRRRNRRSAATGSQSGTRRSTTARH